MDQPNILLIITDQQFAGAMSCAGNDDLITPAMDGLAASGVRFDRAYCTYPLCTPSRVSMFSGKMPHELDVVDNHVEWSDEDRLQTLGHVMSAQGYTCGYAGKWHAPSIAMDDGFGFEAISGFDDNQVAQQCERFFTKRSNRPFFLVASFDNPHNICEWSRSEALPWGPIPEVLRLEECPNLPANFGIPPFEPQAMRLYQQSLPIIDFVKEYSLEQWRRYRYAYYRLIEKVDYEITKILDGLREASLERDTLVIFTSDHGDMNGAHQLIQKSVLYDESVRVPLIISWLGKTVRGVDTSHLVSNGLDLFPTICDYAGAEVPDELRGRSLRPLLEGKSVDDWREFLVSETCFSQGKRNDGRMVVTDRYKYSVFTWGNYREQLIDLENDPGEMVNLAVENKHDYFLSEHRQFLRMWCEETGDNFGRHYSHPDTQYILPGDDLL